MPMGSSNNYSVKDRGDGKNIKERYQAFREAKAQAIRDIEVHDKKMAASARRLLSVPFDQSAGAEGTRSSENPGTVS